MASSKFRIPNFFIFVLPNPLFSESAIIMLFSFYVLFVRIFVSSKDATELATWKGVIFDILESILKVFYL